MKNLLWIMTLIALVFSVGCATGGAAPSSTSGKQLTDDDFKRIGVSETYDKR